MTLEQWQQSAQPARLDSIPPAVVRLVDAAREADAAYQLAERLVVTSFVPASFRGKPAEAAAAMMAGAEIGLSPLAALGAFDVIEGRAAARAITLRAVLQARGHEIELVESTDTRCKMRGRRRGSEEWQTVLWTIDRARAAGLTNKATWSKYPGAMLIARATSELARLVASDALLGLGGGYSSEEIADGFDPAPVVKAAPAARGPRRSLSYAPPADEPVEAQTGAGDVLEAESVEAPAAPARCEAIHPGTGVQCVLEAHGPDVAHSMGDDEPAQAPRTLRRRTTDVEEEQAEIRRLGDELREEKTKARTARPAKLSSEQRGKIMAEFTRLGIINREERLEYSGVVVGRPIESTSDLTGLEAHKLIDHLVMIPDGPAARDAMPGDVIDAEIVPDDE